MRLHTISYLPFVSVVELSLAGNCSAAHLLSPPLSITIIFKLSVTSCHQARNIVYAVCRMHANAAKGVLIAAARSLPWCGMTASTTARPVYNAILDLCALVYSSVLATPEC